ncbi:MAG: peptide deformylase [Phycisphaerales bacterium]|nr:peptide deformylase [Phycisphaerales bacterium]
MAPEPAKLQILHYPAPVLRRKAEPVGAVDESVRAVAARMLELMREAEGVGLAAPQVGLPWRLFVANSGEEGEPDRVYVNPRILEYAGDLVPHEEGCLSLPGIRAQVRRPERITLVATDLEGETFTLQSDGLLARVWQHEYDHLDGILILDRMSPIDRLATRRAVKELMASAGS